MEKEEGTGIWGDFDDKVIEMTLIGREIPGRGAGGRSMSKSWVWLGRVGSENENESESGYGERGR